MTKQRLILIFLACSMLAFLYPVRPAEAEAIHPVRKLYEHHMKLPHEAFLTPYEVCIMALDDLDQERNYEDIHDFLVWYFKRINQKDFCGMSGTTYDFILKGNRDVTVRQYDSVDGYSGLFLFLLNEYEKKTEDSDLIVDNWDTICEIAYTIPYLQQKDGLTIAFKKYEEQYLMDNCEAYGGLTAFIQLGARLKLPFDQAYYQDSADGIKSAIHEELYDEKSEAYYWVNDPTEKAKGINLDKFYPDAYAQIFLIYFNVVDKQEAHEIYEAFCGYHPEETWVAEPIEQQIYCQLVKSKLNREED